MVLTGARQTGKTTLLRQEFPEHLWVSLDLPSVAEQAERDPERFLAEHPPPLIIDEMQYASQLFRFIKVAIDRDRHRMGQFLLTGSQKFTLMREVADSLAGRVGIAALEPLSVEELGEANPGWSALLARGLYPELWRVPDSNASEFYAAYVATYLERDVRQILNVQNLRDFERFLRAAAVRSGHLLNLSDLARDVGIKPHTARAWLSVLEASNQIVLLEPYFENVGKRLVKSPKLYLTDPGLLCFLLGLDARSVASGPLIGTIWETLVFAELRKRAAADLNAAASALWFYRDAQGREIDFLRASGGQLDLVEAKWSADPDGRWMRVLDDVAATLSRSRSQRMGRRFLVCTTPKARNESGVRVTNPAHLD
ncbi:MAG: ATP-binding protein [Steroidobacteraceae bacterium]